MTPDAARAPSGLPASGLVPEDILAYTWLEEVALSPDGGHVAYSVRRSDAERNDYQIDVFVRDLATGSTRRSTSGVGKGGSLAWSRDGARLAYVWNAAEEWGLHVVDAAGGDASRFGVPGSLPTNLDWSPDGTRLAASVMTEAPPTPTLRAEGVPAPTVRVVRRLRYKQDGVGLVEGRFRQIWVLELDTLMWRRITSSERDHTQPRWSWDGRRLAFVGVAREQDTPLGYGQVFVYEEGGATSLLMPEWPGAALSPQWRAGDGAIMFAGHAWGAPVNRRAFFRVWLLELGADNPRELTAGIDQTVGNYAFADQRPGLTNVTVKWPGGTGPAYFLLTERGATHLYAVTEEGEPWQVVGGDAVIFEFSPSARGAIAYGMADPASIGELHLVDGAASQCLTDLNPWLRSRSLAVPESYTYEGLDGADVHAWAYDRAPAGSAGGRPTIIYVHCSMFSWDFSHEFQCLTNAGFRVALFNARGTTAGYGQATALGNYYGKHEAEFDEIMLGVDDLIRRGGVDETRLGVTGGSCGGFMTNWIIGHTDRFAAAVTQRSISNLVSKFGTSDNGPEQAISEGARPPWEDVERLWRSSPLAYVEQITTPLLILHADQDHRCTLDQAEELFAALRWRGKPVELVVFEGENHGVASRGRPGNRIEHLRRMLGWFERHLLGRVAPRAGMAVRIPT